MPQAFTITTTANHVELDGKRAASVTYTVSNKTGQALTGRAALETVPEDASHEAWLALQGEKERPFAIGATQQYIVDINVPPDAAPGEHTFRLDMVATHNPDETYTPGPTIAIVVPEPQPKPRFPLWLIPLIIGAVLLLAVILFLVLRPEGTEVPAVVGLPETDARGTVEAVGLSLEQAGELPSDEVPVGVVMGTTPEAGVRVAEATPVLYVLSAGPAATDTPTPTPTVTPAFAAGRLTYKQTNSDGSISILLLQPNEFPVILAEGAENAEVLDFTSSNGGIYALWVVESGTEFISLVRANGEVIQDGINEDWTTVVDADWAPDGSVLVVEAEVGGSTKYVYINAEGDVVGQPDLGAIIVPSVETPV